MLTDLDLALTANMEQAVGKERSRYATSEAQSTKSFLPVGKFVPQVSAISLPCAQPRPLQRLPHALARLSGLMDARAHGHPGDACSAPVTRDPFAACKLSPRITELD